MIYRVFNDTIVVSVLYYSPRLDPSMNVVSSFDCLE